MSDSEVDGFILAGCAEARKFSTTRLRPGYDQEEVDAFLSAIRETFLGIRKPSLTPDEIRNKQFSTTRLRPGYDEEEVDAFLDEAELRLAARVGARYEAPAAGQESVAADSAQKPYVPGRGDEVPPGLRRVLQGYSWMAWGTVFCGWALFMAEFYVYNLNTSLDSRYLLAVIAPAVLAAVLFGQHIRWSRFLRRPRDTCGATVAACQDGEHALMLDAPYDGHLAGLQVRLAWWAEPGVLLPGESVMFCGRPGGAGRLLVSSSARHRAVVGIGGRRPGPPAGEDAVQDVPHQPVGQGAWQRYLQWGPQAIAGLGFVVAVVATLIAWVPALTDHLGTGQLRAGDCLTGTLGLDTSNPWPFMVTPVRCTDPHLAEVFFAGNAWPKSLTAYPGDKAISDQGWARCRTAFSAYDGTDNSDSAYTITYITPSGGDDWSSGDRWLVCVAYESTDQYPAGMPVNQSIQGSNQ